MMVIILNDLWWNTVNSIFKLFKWIRKKTFDHTCWGQSTNLMWTFIVLLSNDDRTYSKGGWNHNTKKISILLLGKRQCYGT